MRKMLVLLLVLTATPAAAQITAPYTFTVNTVANPDEVNSNFAKFADALNRTGGTMSGTLTSQHVLPSTTNTYDLGSASALFRSGYLRTSLVLAQSAGNYTLTWANPAAARAISIADPGGTDVFTFNAATQTLTNKTVTAPTVTTGTFAGPTLSGTVLGTYTLGGTPTVSCTGCVTWTNLSKSGSSLADLATRAVANLSDGSNVALLNAANTFTGVQTINGAAVANALVVLRVASTTFGIIGASGGIKSNSDTDLGLFAETGKIIAFMTNGSTTNKFAINTAGDWLKGSSIMDPVGTPTINTGFGSSATIAGTDYAFVVTSGGSANTGGTVDFGHAFTTTPVCVGSTNKAGNTITVSTTTTSSVQISYSSLATTDKYTVLCRGY